MVQRSQRLNEAATEAVNRLSRAGTRPVFAPLGELLTWLVSLEDLLVEICQQSGSDYCALRAADPDADVLLGIRYARNAILHGDEVVGVTFLAPGVVLGSARLGMFALGADSSVQWLNRSTLKHAPEPQMADQERSYDTTMAGRPLMTPLARALTFLEDATS
jgi:hypothetical protein